MSGDYNLGQTTGTGQATGRAASVPTSWDQDQRAEMIARIQDYAKSSPAEIRERLVARWRAEYPDAAAQAPSDPLGHLARMSEWKKREASEPDEIWFNAVYHVTLRRFKKDPVFGTEGMIQLGINTHDGTARHDWREFQAIKNQLAGPECEAFELYPAASRLLDPSNYYTLWCFPGVKRLKIGQPHRLVRDAKEAWAPQRGLAREPLNTISNTQAVQSDSSAEPRESSVQKNQLIAEEVQA